MLVALLLCARRGRAADRSGRFETCQPWAWSTILINFRSCGYRATTLRPSRSLITAAPGSMARGRDETEEQTFGGDGGRHGVGVLWGAWGPGPERADRGGVPVPGHPRP